jgi:hypothetical protein
VSDAPVRRRHPGGDPLASGAAAKATADEFYARLRGAVAREPEQAVCSWYLILLSLVNGPSTA